MRSLSPGPSYTAVGSAFGLGKGVGGVGPAGAGGGPWWLIGREDRERGQRGFGGARLAPWEEGGAAASLGS